MLVYYRVYLVLKLAKDQIEASFRMITCKKNISKYINYINSHLNSKLFLSDVLITLHIPIIIVYEDDTIRYISNEALEDKILRLHRENIYYFHLFHINKSGFDV